MPFLYPPGDDPRTPELSREPHDVPESNDVAETDSARLIRTELDKGDFVRGNQHPPALLGSARQDGLAVRRRRPRAAAGPARGGPRDELLGRLLGDRAERAQPVTGADLSHAEEPDGEQVGLVVCQAGALPDHLADQVGALLVGRVEPGADGWFVGEVRFEDELEGSAVLRHVLEVRGEGRVAPLPVVRCRPDRAGHGLDQPADALAEQRQVKILLAGKVLVEDRLADAGPFRDLIHRRGVVAARDEYLPGRVEQLPTASEP